MDLIDRLRDLAAKIPKLKEHGLVKTEEGTKNALIMPFINALGYNVFDPLEVTPELSADVGVKKGEKVDYAVMRNGKPIVLFECKAFGTDLKDEHMSQLYRYFSVTPARFAVLTDGVIYRFYCDLNEPNKMDLKPFFIFNLLEIKEPFVEALKRFSKEGFDEAKILTTANELKYKSAFKGYFEQQLGSKMSEGLIKLAIQETEVFTGRFTQAVIDQFTPLVRDAFRTFVNEQIEKTLKSAIEANTIASNSLSDTGEYLAAAPEAEEDNSDKLIVTTQDEVDAYYIVKSIVREVVDVSRIFMRDTQSYCSVLIDNNNRRPVCRIRFNYSQKYIGIMDGEKNEEKIAIKKVDDIYQYADRLKAAAQHWVAPAASTVG